MGRIKDITGQRFGRLYVISFDHLSEGKNLAYWRCVCDCGKEAVVRGTCLRSGESKSCGCLARELSSIRNSTHHCRNTRLYHIWIDMRQRCMNPNQPDYPRWGGRGISVCEPWLESFDNFRKWAMESGYTDYLTIDRIDVNGNYCPENCRWATYEDQANNRRSSKLIEYKGEIRSETQWSRLLGGNRNLVHSRLKSGWSIEKALTTPVHKRCKE